jgi:hypothetical protein
MSMTSSIGAPTSPPVLADAPTTIARRRSRSRTCKGAFFSCSGNRPHKPNSSLDFGGTQPRRAKCSSCSPTAAS